LRDAVKEKMFLGEVAVTSVDINHTQAINKDNNPAYTSHIHEVDHTAAKITGTFIDTLTDNP